MNRYRHSFLFFCFVSSMSFLLNTSAYSQNTKNELDSILNDIRLNTDYIAWVNGIDYLQSHPETIAQQPNYYQAYVYEVMATTYYKIGDAEASEQLAVKSLSLLDKNSIAARVRVLCLLGILQQEKGLFPLSEKQYNKALFLADNTLDSLYILNNQATLYKEQKLFDKAIATYQLGLDIIPRLSADTLYHSTKFLDNLGNARSLSGEGGAPELLKALQLEKSLSNTIRNYSIHRHLVQHYIRRNDTTQALKYAPQMYRSSRQIGDKSYEKEALGLLLTLNQTEYASRYVQLSDSLNILKGDIENAYALLKYDKSEAERQALSAQLVQERTLFLAITGLVLILIPSILLIIRHKRKRQRAVFETEQAIAQHVHDDIANNLFMVMNKLSDKKDIPVLDAIDKIYQQARSLSRTHNALDTSQPFIQVLSDLFTQFSSEKITVIPKNTSKVPWGSLSKIKKEALYKVLQELLTNTLKHSNASFAVISFEYQASKVRVQYRDNGIGAQEEPKSGLRYAENRIKAVSGSITFTSNTPHGFQAEIVI